MFLYLQVADDAERLRTLQSTGGSGHQPVGSTNQKVSCCWVTATLCADVSKLWEDDIIQAPVP